MGWTWEQRAYAKAHAFDPAPMPLVPEYVPSPTVEQFIVSTSEGLQEEMRLLILMGSRGEGKTTAGIYACLVLAETMERIGLGKLLPIRVMVVRDTWVNLNRTTLQSFDENARRGLPIEWADGRRQCSIKAEGVEYCRFFFFGMDNRDDADKAQGFQAAILWLEEVAPAAELAAGMPPETLGIGGTSLRQPGVPHRIIVTMNPPDEDHWIMEVEKTLDDVGLAEIDVRRFNIPPGEKSAHFRQLATGYGATITSADSWDRAAREFDAYRKTNEALLGAINRQDLVARLVKGEVGGLVIGEAVVPEFGMNRHSSSVWIPPIPGVDMIRCWDFGLTPSTVWLQVTPIGNVNIFGSKMSVNRALGEHIIEEVIPFQEKYRIFPYRETYEKGKKGFRFRDIGDPAMSKGNEMIKSEQTAAWVIENMLGASPEPGPVAWNARRQALKTCFYRPGTPRDRALIHIYRPESKMLVQALNGKAHYTVNPATGRIVDTVESVKKASGLFFQELDALAYGLAVLFPAEDWQKRIAPPAPAGRRMAPKSWVGV